MKAGIIKVSNDPEFGYGVEIVHRHQSFRLAYKGDNDDVKWMAKCFNDCLKKVIKKK